MPVATVIVSGDGRAIAVNPAWCELTGLSDQESRGDGWGRVLRLEDRHRLVGALGDLAASGGAASAECELQLYGRPCRSRWFLRTRDVGITRLAIVTAVEIDGHDDRFGIGALTDQVGWLAAHVRDLAAIDTSHAAALLDASHNLYRAFVSLTPDSGRSNGWPVPNYAGSLPGARLNGEDFV
jgi:PAS domain S-box-containing protein